MTVRVVDNTVLSNFAHIEPSTLLQLAFDHLITVPAVLKEFEVGVELGRVPALDWSWLTIADLNEAERVLAGMLGATLGRGEAECIAIAQTRRGVFLSDDRDARREAAHRGIAVSGTLGVLVTLVRRGVAPMAEADEMLTTMKAHGYRCPVNSLSDL